MFKRFQISIDDIGFLADEKSNHYREIGEKLFTSLDKSFEGDVKEYLNENKELSADLIKNDWFPKIDCDVFISHSHIDEEKALILSGWLFEELNIVSFIDSKLWKYTNNLLKKLDNEYTLNSDEKTYNYDKRNFSTSHAHVMLSSSLVEMIDSSECLIFINGEGSSSFKNDLETNTLSPWIYTELTVSDVIKIRIPIRHLTKFLEKNAGLENFSISESVATEDAKMKVNYSVSPILSRLPSITPDHLYEWIANKDQDKNNFKNLDVLYKTFGWNYE
ncbi:hypothetical protein WCT93_02565 [Pectobacterium atrosepticum]|jgi:hypothetical protein|uniref:hypothetical protein n=1 Tax=Pectobacterium atrosepticum TaxID=29471 RepID=UPI003016A46A